MKKILILLTVCVLLFSGCSNAELEEQNATLQETIDEQDEKIDELNEKLDNAKIYVQTLSDENTKLKKENTELKDTLEDLQSPPAVNLLGQWAGKTYENEFFQVTASLPKGWNYLGKEDLAEAIGVGLDLVNSLSDIKIESIGDETIIPLFLAYLENNQTSLNTNVLLSYSKYAVKYELQNYIKLLSPQFEQMFSSVGKVTTSQVEDINIGGMDMKKVNLMIEISDSDQILFADYHYFYYGDYLGSFSTTYTQDKKESVQEFVKNINFN